jgi:hypothetical protein
MINDITFEGWPKTPRLSNGGVTITEKIDGTNACVVIMPVDPIEAWGQNARDHGGVDWAYAGEGKPKYLVGAQSRKRLIFPGADNAGFAQWVRYNVEELVELLGPGRHFGEWWGQGIQRRYDMDRKVFSLFNTHRWQKVASERPDWWDRASTINLDIVPVLHLGRFSDLAVQDCLDFLREEGSVATLKYGVRFMRPEGVIIRHRDLGGNLKAFVENDDVPKGESSE